MIDKFYPTMLYFVLFLFDCKFDLKRIDLQKQIYIQIYKKTKTFKLCKITNHCKYFIIIYAS